MVPVGPFDHSKHRTLSGSGHYKLVGGTYRLEARIGAGAMGVVYRARHAGTGADVAVKLVHPHIAEGAINVARFEREVGVSGRVGHDGIVRVHDAGVDPEDGSLFVAMELLHGGSLEERLRQPGTTAYDAVRLIREVCAPLAAAHSAGLVHRDLKPENVFIHRPPGHGEQVKLLDFGIACDLDQSGLTGTNAGLGTPNYMAPEQATNAKAVTPAADVWSVGVMLYWYLRGRLPFEGDGPFETVFKAMTQAHEPFEAGEAPESLVAVIEACLQKKPDRRPRAAGDLGLRLSAILESNDGQALADRTLPSAIRRLEPTLEPSQEASGAEFAVGDLARSLRERAKSAARQTPPPEDSWPPPEPTDGYGSIASQRTTGGKPFGEPPPASSGQRDRVGVLIGLTSIVILVGLAFGLRSFAVGPVLGRSAASAEPTAALPGLASESERLTNVPQPRVEPPALPLASTPPRLDPYVAEDSAAKESSETEAKVRPRRGRPRRKRAPPAARVESPDLGIGPSDGGGVLSPSLPDAGLAIDAGDGRATSPLEAASSADVGTAPRPAPVPPAPKARAPVRPAPPPEKPKSKKEGPPSDPKPTDFLTF